MSIIVRGFLIFSLMISMGYSASLLAAERREEPKKATSDTIQSNDSDRDSESDESAPVYDIEETDFC